MSVPHRLPRVAVALDVATAEDALHIVDCVGPTAAVWKVGLELFTVAGPTLVRDVMSRGGEVFLDLKLHDIPNTVARAVAAAAELGVGWLTVHAAGGSGMLRAAVDAAPPELRLLAVTVLTSLGAAGTAEVFGREGADPGTEALRLARLAESAGVLGFVCSGQEIQPLREALGAAAFLVTPGIRPVGSSAGDQARVTTPTDATRWGSDLLVIGRPVIQSADPRAALRQILEEVRAAHQARVDSQQEQG